MRWWEDPVGKTFEEMSFDSKFVLPQYEIPKQIAPRNIPYPENLNDAKLSLAETLLIDDSLNYYLSNTTEEQLRSDTTFKNIKETFYTTFCQTLNSVYQSENKAFRLFKVLDAGRYFAVHFEYTDQEYEPTFEPKADLEEYIQQVIPTEKMAGKSYHIQRIIKIYGKDTIILAKPKQLRYWLPSIALQDADEAFADYIKARYQ